MAAFAPANARMLIYIHGFNSSSRSGKARALGAWLAARGRGGDYVCPDLPHRPSAAIELLDALITASPLPPKLVGSSLGGFYAIWLAEKHGLKAVHVNPCVACHEKLADQVGRRQTNWYTGEEYEFTSAHCAELAALHRPHLSHPGNHLLFVETGDEVLDYREAVAYFDGARQVVVAGGDHGFSRFGEHIPEIVAF